MMTFHPLPSISNCRYDKYGNFVELFCFLC